MKKWYAMCLGVVFSGVSFIAQADHEQFASVVKNPAGNTYFEINIQDAGLLKGNYKGWCGDWSTAIGENIQYHANYYSSTSENLPAGLVDHPENLDEVNWLINKRFVGRTSPTGLGIYTKGDVQLAIWTLLDDVFDASTIGEYSQQRVDELAARARTEGSGYVPRCKDLIGIILEPSVQETGTRVQTVITEVPRHHFPKCVVPDFDN